MLLLNLTFLNLMSGNIFSVIFFLWMLFEYLASQKLIFIDPSKSVESTDSANGS